MNTDWTSVTATHLSRKAALYIRQSTLHQVQVHIGSTAVQMNQMEFIERLGWPKDRVLILAGDMGITGTSAEARADWQLLHKAIARSEAGGVAFSATARASRTYRVVAVHLRDAGIPLPANRPTGGGVVWRPARVGSVARIVANPHYAGYYCWGRKHASLLFGRVERGPGRGRAKARTVPREQWHLVDNHHEPYIEPDRFWRMRAVAERSAFRLQQPPLRGAALIQGLVWCGDCDRRMHTRSWKHRDRIGAKYVCLGPATDPRDGHCRHHSALRIDPLVAARVLDVLRGLDLDLVRATLDRLRNESEARTAHLRQGCQIAEQEAKAAKERLKAADPRNERVFRLLESELETALAEAARRKAEYDLALGVIPP